MHWEKNKTIIDTINQHRIAISAPGDLVIRTVVKTDAGPYTCLARNEAGTVKSNTAILRVYGQCYYALSYLTKYFTKSQIIAQQLFGRDFYRSPAGTNMIN